MDESVAAHRDAPASSSRESASEPRGKVVSGKHSVKPRFLKDRNCDICMRTKRTRAPCRTRTGAAVLRAENFGVLITADHKVLGESCESRNNRRYASVVQDLTTQWIQSYPCKTKTSQETLRSLQKFFLEPNGKPKVINTDNPKNWANLVKIHFGIIVLQHRTDRKLMGLLREQCAELRKGRLRYCCNQVWMKNGGRIPWNATAICEIFRIFCLMGRPPWKGGSEYHLMAQLFHLEQWVESHPISAKDLSRLHHFGKKVLPGIFLGVHFRGENLERRHFGRIH